MTTPEPHWHLALSPGAFLLSRRRDGTSPWIAAAASVLIDVDHFVDMAVFRLTGERLRQIVPLHSWELVALQLGSRSRIRRSLAFGFLIHLCADWLLGDYEFKQLSLGYRLSRRMRTGWLGDWVEWPRGGCSALLSSASRLDEDS